MQTIPKFKTGSTPEAVLHVAMNTKGGIKKAFAMSVAVKAKELAKKRNTTGTESVHVSESDFRAVYGIGKSAITYFKVCLKECGIKPAVGFEDGVLFVWSRGDFKTPPSNRVAETVGGGNGKH